MKPLVRIKKDKLQFIFKKKKIEYELDRMERGVLETLVTCLSWGLIDDVLKCMRIQKAIDYDFEKPARCNWGKGTPELEQKYNKDINSWYLKRKIYLSQFFRFELLKDT